MLLLLLFTSMLMRTLCNQLQGTFPVEKVFMFRAGRQKAEESAKAESAFISGSASVLYLAQFGKGWW